MKKYFYLIMLFLLNCVIIRGMLYTWNSIPLMSTDNQSTMMTYYTLGLLVLEFIIFVLSINLIRKFIRVDKI